VPTIERTAPGCALPEVRASVMRRSTTLLTVPASLAAACAFSQRRLAS
jgi:hypothetical protein